MLLVEGVDEVTPVAIGTSKRVISCAVDHGNKVLTGIYSMVAFGLVMGTIKQDEKCIKFLKHITKFLQNCKNGVKILKEKGIV